MGRFAVLLAAVATVLPTLPSPADAQQRGRRLACVNCLYYGARAAPIITGWAARSGASPGWFMAGRQSLGSPTYPPGVWMRQYPTYPNYFRRQW